MKIAICGASGFIGTHLVNYYNTRRVSVTPLPKDLFLTGSFDELVKRITGCDVVINLAGANLNHRWDRDYKKELYDSRIETTRTLVNAINSLAVKPSVFISTSAVGYYPSDTIYRESNAVAGKSFLSRLCVDWEQQARRVSSEVRCIITRFGIVLATDGGAYPAMVKTTNMGFMTKIGSGEQFLSWIELHDLIRAFDFVITRSEICGVMNFCAPHYLSNNDFAHLVAKKYHSKLIIPVPDFMLRLIMGESSILLTDGQRVYPERLIKHGFCFQYPSIINFLDELK